MVSPEEFNAKAKKAAESFATMSPPETIAKSLINDQPTIDSAVKNMMSLVTARSFAGSHPSTQQMAMDKVNAGSPNEKCFFISSKNPSKAALICARMLLKEINGFQFSQARTKKSSTGDQKNEEEEETLMISEVVRIVWNGIIKNQQKPSKILGLDSLIHVYPMILTSLQQNSNFPDDVDKEEGIAFMDEFGVLLSQAKKRRTSQIDQLNMDEDDDSCLLWDKDRGEAELERRRRRREQHASFFAKKTECN